LQESNQRHDPGSTRFHLGRRTGRSRLGRRASAWPRQSVRFVVPFAPGGTSEIVARTVAQELTKQLGQTVFVDNKGGGAGVPAMTEVAKAARPTATR
jgi:tripartite-type tricarboxylate transporter receptor subunit TctC